MKLEQILKQGIDTLKENHIDEASINAKILLGYILNLKKEDLLINYDKEIDEENAKTFLGRNK